jgi:hypothetical protein
MTSSLELFQRAINSIKLVGNTKGEDIKAEDIAQKAGLSMEKFQAYLNGGEKIPDGLTSELLSKYDITIRRIQWTDKVSFDIPPDDEDEEIIK